MCGIIGFYYLRNKNKEQSFKLATKMLNSIKSRGPDFSKVLSFCESKLYLGHNRLSIQDLSESGNQPMMSASGRYCIVFNGEIYNFNELRKSLVQRTNKIIDWRSHSDTEVLLESINEWGIKKVLPQLNGMFAFAIYDRKENKLTFVRDRFGEKPLYIFSDENSFAFSSELKPIEIWTKNLSINESAVDALFRFSYIPAPFSIYNEVFKLLPGHYLEINLSNYKKLDYSNIKPFWRVVDTVKNGMDKKNKCKDINESIEEVEFLLKKAVKLRMISDVPLGAFLSGGIDSTCITALMQSQTNKNIKTFSIGFNDQNYNEAKHARQISNILGTEHYELYLEANDMIELIPNIPNICDEPFADSSQLATLMVSKFAKKHVSVALTGDAGDEVFCGYNRYILGAKLAKKFGKFSWMGRVFLGKSLATISPNTYDAIMENMSNVFTKLKKYKRVGDNLHKFARVINFKDEVDLYSKLILIWPEKALNNEVIDIATDITEIFNYKNLTLPEKMMWQDTIGYMQNDILTKVDRASMSVSLETRLPFLDNDVYEYAWSLPLEFKMHNGLTKYPLRKIISNYVPNEIMNRPKAGFGVPIHNWLRNELKDWAEDLLSEESLNKTGQFKNSVIRDIWAAHKSGKKNEQYALWNVLMYQQWYMSRL